MATKKLKSAPAGPGARRPRSLVFAPVDRIEDLIADPKNARSHNERNVGVIQAGIEEVGAARSIVIDEGNVVLAGNATVKAAGAAGIQKVIVVDADGTTLVAVRRAGLTAKEKHRLALLDNRSGELATWDADMLEQLQADGVSMDGIFTQDELLDILSGRSKAGRTDPDDVPAPRPTDITVGQLFQLGSHRVLCGDATASADVARLMAADEALLMVTDPRSSERTGTVQNDNRVDWTPAWQLFRGHVAYVWHAGIFASVVEGSLATSGFTVRAQIIWRKSRIVLSRGHYHWQHEPCWYAVRDGKTGHWAGSRNQSTVWPISTPLHRCQTCGAIDADQTIDEMPSTVWDIDTKEVTGITTHGTQKPVECMARPMRNHHAPIVYDPFSGSGTTIIAAELHGRSCRALELDPVYVQQTIDRWEAFTGLKATQVG